MLTEIPITGALVLSGTIGRLSTLAASGHCFSRSNKEMHLQAGHERMDGACELQMKGTTDDPKGNDKRPGKGMTNDPGRESRAHM